MKSEQHRGVVCANRECGMAICIDPLRTDEEELKDPFQATCPYCDTAGQYPKAAIQNLDRHIVQ